MNLEAIQKAGLVLLKEFDRVCKKNNIEYFMCGGTLLGAVRHHGFIPWDDDVDVILTRDQFDRLTSLPATEWGEQFRFVNYDMFSKEHFFDTLGHLFYIGEDIRLPFNPLKKIEGVCDDELNYKLCMDILVFDNGEIVEEGSHEKLLKKGGLDSQLWQAQSQYYA